MFILKQGDVVEALFAVEQGRAQALTDLMNSKYETETPSSNFLEMTRFSVCWKTRMTAVNFSHFDLKLNAGVTYLA